jgi:NAD(P)-dependent dehydrogenase (short-subunit alcohol dehydrogenase family)
MGGGRLDGKVAIVTGGASGFGLGIVEKFVAENAAGVMVLDINDDNGTALLEQYKGKNVAFLKADITSRVDWQKALEATISRWGKIDVVVNNAGTTYRNKPSLEVTEAEFDKVFLVNVKSIYLSVDVVLPRMIEQGTGGSFIQISSTAALRPRPGLTWYNATKGAVSTASKSLAVEYGPQNVRFNCICPVAGDTPLLGMFMGADTPEKRAQFKATVPLGRLSTPADIANSTAFLASDEAQFLTGLDLEVDGGRCV